MRLLKQAIADIVQDMWWMLSLGIVLSLVLTVIVRIGFSYSIAVDENASVERFIREDVYAVMTEDIPILSSPSSGSLASEAFDSESQGNLRSLISRNLTSGKAGTFVTLFGSIGGLNIETIVVFLGAYADLTPYQADRGDNVSFVLSHDMAAEGGGEILIGGENYPLDVAPENMDIYHPLHYMNQYEVRYNYPRTLFVFCSNYDLACKLVPDVAYTDLIGRLVLLDPLEDDVVSLRRAVLSERGQLMAVRSMAEQVRVASEAGVRTHASILVFFAITAAGLFVAMLLSLHRMLVKKVPDYATCYLFGAPFVELTCRIALVSGLCQILPVAATVVNLEVAGILNPIVVSLVLLGVGMDVVLITGLVCRRLAVVIGHGLRGE